MSTEKPELLVKWLKALRSGEYKQARGVMCRSSTTKPGGSLSFCCLGVLKREMGKLRGPDITYRGGRDDKSGYAPVKAKLVEWGLDQEILMDLNDRGKWGFKRIADYIEEEWKEMNT